ncbi:MAG TPA: hypothetical protein PKZ76_01280 [Xanthomonadaceae bacterium]|nr:hypothetical protein [Xanthomonadaceae bacterium]
MRLFTRGELRAPEFDEVMAQELRAILATDDDGRLLRARKALWGLAFSGGGIRSASFALGLMQALARCRVLGGFHYLSTVSGGGYAGAFLQGAMKRFGLGGAIRVLTVTAENDKPLDENEALRVNRPIRHLREYSNYLSPRKSALSGDTLGMASTCLRNIVLTQLQLFSLMLFLGVLPLLVFPVLTWLASRPSIALLLAGVIALLSAAGLGWIATRAQGHHQPTGLESPSAGVSLVATLLVAGLAIASALGALGVLVDRTPPQDISVCLALDLLQGWPGCQDYELGFYAAGVHALIWLFWLVIATARSPGEGERSPIREHWLRFLLGTLATAVLAGALMMMLQAMAPAVHDGSTWRTIILGTPIVFTAVAILATVHVGLVGPALSDLQREAWARVGGKSAAVVLVGIGASLGLLVIGPWWMGYLIWSDGAWSGIMAGLASALSWLAVTLGGVVAAARVTREQGGASPRSGKLRRVLMSIAPWVFILGLWVAIGLLAQALIHALGADAMPARSEADSLGGYLAAIERLATSYRSEIWILAASALGAWVILSLGMDANELSLNAFYRNRLVRCYLGATNARRNAEPVTNFDPRDDLLLEELRRKSTEQQPLYPLICASMNLVAAKQLDWQDRRAASFVMTPHYCGHLPPPGRTGAEAAGDVGIGERPHGLAKSVQLGTAIAVSGAAVSPNMGERSSPAITFLLTLFDARLGWWLPNRVRQGAFPTDRPRFPGWHLLAELLGITHGTGRFAHVSDGGHFENLGIYELVRRRCRFILCSDAGADPGREFADLGNAIRKCRVDFGAEIEIDVTQLRPDSATGRSRRHATLGKIRYADGSRGLLLYLKPSLIGDEPADIQHYACAHPSFPHQPTSDQFFDEAQFECYRKLGQHVGERVLGDVMSRIGGSPGKKVFTLKNSDLKERVLTELSHQLYEPVDAIGRNFARHSDTMAHLFATLRSTPALAVLDAQIYPGWSQAMAALPEGTPAAGAPPSPAKLPGPEDFRACFYFCQELIQFMEAVYLDLDLEMNWHHPDNRGWMNIFQHWSWSPTFRLSWALSAQTYGARFVSFCETRIGIPRMASEVRVRYIGRKEGQPLDALANTLVGEGEISAIEAGALSSATLASADAVDALFVLKLRWRNFLPDAPVELKEMTMGVAAIAGGTLVFFRIRDHLRRMGLGTEFMRRLIAQRRIAEVAIRAGHYGAVGVLTNTEAQKLIEQLEKMRSDALLQNQSEQRRKPGTSA